MNLSVIALFLISLTPSVIAQTRPALDSESLLKLAGTAYRAKRYAESISFYKQSAKLKRLNVGSLYDIACCYALDAKPKEAIEALRLAIKQGYRDSGHLQTDSDFDSIHDLPDWHEAVATCTLAEAKYLASIGKPERAKLVISDIPLFWQAYDRMLEADPSKQAEILQREYFDRGSVGLKDFKAVRGIKTENMVKYLHSHPDFYRSVREETLAFSEQMSEIRKDYVKFKKIYPAAVFPPIYVCVGAFSGGGTVSQNGLLVSAEMMAQTKDTPVYELNSWEASVRTDRSDLPPLVMHELIHFQQRNRTNPTLLSGCLNEGSADFISELATGKLMKRTANPQHAYGDAHERELWKQFEAEMNKPNTSKWLYSGSEKGERPVDMGYWMGYKICQAYYERATDKKQAVNDILHIMDMKEFLAKSGYAEKFK